MADFHHLGYFPFCIKAPLQPLDIAAEMPLTDAMRIFWLAKRARVVIKFSFNAIRGDTTGIPTNDPESLVRLVCNIDEEKSVYEGKSLRERVCLDEQILISGSVANEDGKGNTEYIFRMFTTAGLSGEEFSSPFPRVSAESVEGVVSPSATVRVTCSFALSVSGYYSMVYWFNGLTPPFSTGVGPNARVVPLEIKTGGNVSELSTGVTFALPFLNSANPTIETLSVEFLP
jgi:hypothetical protein